MTGQAAKRAALAEVICRAAGREDIPIHCGREASLAHGPGQPTPVQYETIASLPHRKDRPPNTAVDFMRETIRARPGEIVLLTIGPLSNVALLFSLDPEIPSLLKGLVSMAGVYFGEPGAREWNCICDPTAAAIVYASRRPEHYSIGLDVTMKCRMDAAMVRAEFAGEPLGTVRRIAEHWFKECSEIVFHDPLAAATIFHPELCKYEAGKVCAPPDRPDGRLCFTACEGPDQVASTVDCAGFFKEYFSVF